ncbi:alpha-mannosidase [Paenibacillus larvae subsp. larvae]|uniref:Alpha-mannosidase n=1 Tax=Paenibacillus larvae subsp. larvae TaxID=147375 RepID=A0A2L1UBL5_9BACL|nr:hypothetical protein B1222_19220 [Paenibacillus larvae subsp. pulvifaciens]AQZ45693.1 hypothetical protein B5S25_02830 [Paenibacillus larvae subsp. pulvifaciens]AVF25536.1 alpha-mannosidase [Paenibacillus larvae subsp. larvae]AVF30313.1 alpha-mannosidase [Paenibacillus larvae subsp. larvae]MBH0340828.1 hypothetical protein [Paenibacillus larvae]
MFNTGPRAYNGSIETVVFTKNSKFRLVTTEGKSLPFDVTDQTYLSGGKQIVVTAEGERESEVPGYYRTVLTLLVNEVPSMGYTALIVQEKDESMQQIEETKETFIQNSLLKLSFAHGKLALENVRTNEKMEKLLKIIYGSHFQQEYADELKKLVKEWQNKKWTTSHPISEKNVYLITYGDSIYEEGVPTLVTLQKFFSSKPYFMIS